MSIIARYPVIAMLVMVFIMVFGANVSSAFAKDLQTTATCKQAGFAAAPFTGTLAQKEAQARRLAVGTVVMVDGKPIALASGETLWGKCSEGPTELEVLTAKVATLEAENAALSRLAYVDVKGADGKVTRMTWQAYAEKQLDAAAEETKAAQADAKSAATWAWVFGLATIAFALLAFYLARKLSNLTASKPAEGGPNKTMFQDLAERGQQPEAPAPEPAPHASRTMAPAGGD